MVWAAIKLFCGEEIANRNFYANPLMGGDAGAAVLIIDC
jgi:hypothetical protein